MYLSKSELQQIDLLKGKKPSERFQMMLGLIGDQVEAMKAGLRYKNPDMNDEEIHQCLRSYLNLEYLKKWPETLKIKDDFDAIKRGG